jgi:hypothetical protein
LTELGEEEATELHNAVEIVTQSVILITPEELLYAMDNNHNLQILEYAKSEAWKLLDSLTRTAVLKGSASIETTVD